MRKGPRGEAGEGGEEEQGMIKLETSWRAEGKSISTLFEHMCAIPNRALLYSFYPYLWELNEERFLLDRFITHITTVGGAFASASRMRLGTPSCEYHSCGACVCCRYSYVVAATRFTSIEHRACTYRGGLVAELQKLLQIEKDGAIGARPLSKDEARTRAAHC